MKGRTGIVNGRAGIVKGRTGIVKGRAGTCCASLRMAKEVGLVRIQIDPSPQCSISLNRHSFLLLSYSPFSLIQRN